MKLRGLYAITPERLGREALMDKLERALQGGIALLQYRRKPGTVEEARAVVELAGRYGVPVIINDAWEMVAQTGAAGAHLGRDDDDLARCRAALPGRLLGASCYDQLPLARQAVAAGADYVAFGSMFASPTKPVAVRAPLGLFAEARALGVPLAAIGGITVDNAPQVLAAGADLLAVISDLFDAPDIRERARQYGKLLK